MPRRSARAMRAPLLGVLAAALLLLSACGGVQRPAPPAAEIAWASDIFSAVPADAGGAWISRASALDPGTRALSEAVILDTFSRWFGFDVDRDAGVAQFGFDPVGEMALFARGTSITLLVSLSDAERFDHVRNEIVTRQADLPWRLIKPAAVPVFTARPTPGMRFDLARHGDFGLARVSLGEEAADAADRHLAELFHGYPDMALVHETDAYRDMSAALDVDRLTAIGYLRTEFASELLLVLGSAMQERSVSGGARGRDSLDQRYGGAEERARCEARSASMAAAMPWIGVASGEVHGGGETWSRRSHYHMALDEERSARLASFFPGQVAEDGPLTSSGAIGGYLNIDVGAIWEALPETPEYASCPDLAMVAGFAGLARSTFGRRVAYNLELMDGRAALWLGDLRIEGFIPLADMALLIGSPQPNRLFRQIQRQLDQMGAQGRVLESTAHTTFEYRLLHLRLRMMRSADRVVLSIGGAPPVVTHWMMSEFERQGPEGLRIDVRGEALRPILQSLWNYAEMSELIPPDVASTIAELLLGSRQLEHAAIRTRIGPQGFSISLDEERLLEPVD